jgi:phosphatidylglycerol lysyltransferase
VRVVAGAPVCAEARLAAVAAEFERDAAAAGHRVCYFAAEARLERVYRGRPTHAMVLLGAQPAWRPDAWAAAVTGHASLRAQLNRARNKGVRVDEWPAARAAAAPALREVLAEWLSTRGLPPLHFLVEPDTLDRLHDRRVFVAERDGAVQGFLVASPVPAREGWLVEQLVRGHAAPNGTTELLLDAAVRALAARGAAYVTLGLAPLSRRARLPSVGAPLWLRVVLGLARAHGRRFYDFDGLDAFKAKFRPERWEPVYAIVAGPRFTPRALYAVAGAFGATPPPVLVARALARAAGQELRWAMRRGRRAAQASSAVRDGGRAG